eukprot:8889243-Karenia_brevis.AAC.1
MDGLDVEWGAELRQRLNGTCGRQACHLPMEAPSAPRRDVDQIYGSPRLEAEHLPSSAFERVQCTENPNVPENDDIQFLRFRDLNIFPNHESADEMVLLDEGSTFSHDVDKCVSDGYPLCPPFCGTNLTRTCLMVGSDCSGQF